MSLLRKKQWKPVVGASYRPGALPKSVGTDIAEARKKIRRIQFNNFLRIKVVNQNAHPAYSYQAQCAKFGFVQQFAQ
jgi:hypothetical protein